MSEFQILPSKFEDAILQFIKNKYDADDLSIAFPNALLREDVLELLDRYCTVVYYPLENEENNGFRLKEMPFADGTKHNFVFINTAQTMEKQVFTAAHELGHIWNVDEEILRTLQIQGDEDLREQIINRFAAVLLIPPDHFSKSVNLCLDTLGEGNKQQISYFNLLKMIVLLMNHFFVPMKAVVLRLVELNFFNIEIANATLGNTVFSTEQIKALVDEIIVECGYTKLQNPSNKKWIEGLGELLEEAEKNNLVLKSKIDVMRDKFGIVPTSSPVSEFSSTIPLQSQ